jgi:hypothetical protein
MTSEKAKSATVDWVDTSKETHEDRKGSHILNFYNNATSQARAKCPLAKYAIRLSMVQILHLLSSKVI